MTHYRTARPTLAQWVKQTARHTRRLAWARVCPAGAIIQSGVVKVGCGVGDRWFNKFAPVRTKA